MPKYRKFVKGGKNLPIRIKNKIGGRKSNRGVTDMTNKELGLLLNTVRKRDRNKLRRALEVRNVLPS